MSQKLNKRELMYLSPAVLYGWQIEKTANKPKGYWDGDRTCPVTLGAMAIKLTEEGYLENVSLFPNHLLIRATKKAEGLRCKNCHNGQLFNNDDERIGECPTCGGIGLVN